MAGTKKLTKEDLIEAIGNMTVIELSELVKVMEERFGVSAQQTIVQTAPGTAAGGTETGAVAEEKTEFDVLLKEVGEQRIKVIRAVREITSIGLKEAKDLVESAPSKVKEGIGKEEAEKIKAKLEEAGAKAEIE